MTMIRMKHLRQLGNSISVTLPSDEDGFTGRECPNPDCEGHFKITFGTGLKGENLPCHCPYCGHTGSHDHFYTRQQIKYVESIAHRKIYDAIHKDLKSLEFDMKPKGPFGIGFSMKLEAGRPTPIHNYCEPKLETEVVCSKCTLRYAVYGVFAFCPDCGQHNSLQILEKNLDLVRKMLELAKEVPVDISEKLIENALEDCISAFDGYGREVCRINADRSLNPSSAASLSFQNLSSVRKQVSRHFGFDLAEFVSQEDWSETVTLFHKRHLLAHKMGVVDEDYIRRSGDSDAIIGRKIVINSQEVDSLVRVIYVLSRELTGSFGDTTV